jgi:hypothetical protein
MKIFFRVRDLSGDVVLNTAPVDVDSAAFDAARDTVLDLKRNGFGSYRVFRVKVKDTAPATV